MNTPEKGVHVLSPGLDLGFGGFGSSHFAPEPCLMLRCQPNSVSATPELCLLFTRRLPGSLYVCTHPSSPRDPFIPSHPRQSMRNTVNRCSMRLVLLSPSVTPLVPNRRMIGSRT